MLGFHNDIGSTRFHALHEMKIATYLNRLALLDAPRSHRDSMDTVLVEHGFNPSNKRFENDQAERTCLEWRNCCEK